MHPITDKAELALDFPDKTYIGSFARASSFEARIDPEGATIKLAHTSGERRVAELHLHWYLFADILKELAGSIAAGAEIDDAHRRPLEEAAAAFAHALGQSQREASQEKP
jgi:hypothetical protein